MREYMLLVTLDLDDPSNVLNQIDAARSIKSTNSQFADTIELKCKELENRIHQIFTPAYMIALVAS